MGITPWSPLASGLLSGKYVRGRDSKKPGGRIEAIKQSGNPGFTDEASRHAVAKAADARAYKIGDASVVVSNPNVAPIRILALLGNSSDASALRNVLGAVLARFHAIEFFARETFPEVFGPDIFEPLGFVKEPLNQILMRHDL